MLTCLYQTVVLTTGPTPKKLVRVVLQNPRVQALKENASTQACDLLHYVDMSSFIHDRARSALPYLLLFKVLEMIQIT